MFGVFYFFNQTNSKENISKSTSTNEGLFCCIVFFVGTNEKEREKKTKNYARKKIWAMYNQLSNSKARFDFFLSGIKERILIVNVGVKRYRTIDIGTIVLSNGS